MKTLVLGFCALTLIAFTSCKEDASSKIKEENIAQAAERDANASTFPVIKFDKTEHDFGAIENGTAVETKFSYTNTGKAPLVVTEIKSTCGCTVPSDWSREPLASGETASFTVKFNGKGNGITSKTITMTANTEKGKEAVRIKANINNPEAAATAAAKKAKSPIQTLSTTQTKTSTQPGHEGHNHN